MISFEETVQTVMNLVRENEALKAQLKMLQDQLKAVREPDKKKE